MITPFKDFLQKRIQRHRYIFHHIPKCGGTSIRHALGEWFTPIKDYRADTDVGERFEQFCQRRYDLASLKPDEILCSHFEQSGCHLHERYPEALDPARFRIITFIRDPLEVQVSLYFHEKRLGAVRDPMEVHLMRRKNYLAARIPCTMEDYQEKLSRYFFIGLLEQAQESFDRLAARLGKPRIALPVKNKSARDTFSLSAEFMTEFRRANELDYRIYDECRRIYETGR